MNIDSHLCLNFTEINHREVGDTMRCFGDNKLQNTFFTAILFPFGRVTKSLHGACHLTDISAYLNFVPIGSDLLELFPKR